MCGCRCMRRAEAQEMCRGGTLAPFGSDVSSCGRCFAAADRAHRRHSAFILMGIPCFGSKFPKPWATPPGPLFLLPLPDPPPLYHLPFPDLPGGTPSPLSSATHQ